MNDFYLQVVKKVYNIDIKIKNDKRSKTNEY